MYINEGLSAARQYNFQFAFIYLCDLGFLSLIIIKTKKLRNRLDNKYVIRIVLSNTVPYFKTNQNNNKCYTELYINKKPRMCHKRGY